MTNDVSRRAPFRVRRVVAALWGVVALAVGLALLLQADGRTIAANYVVVRSDGAWLDHAHPMHPWGWAYLAVGLVVLAGVVADRASIAIVGLCASAGVSALWESGTSLAALHDNGSLTPLGFGLGVVGAQLIAVWRLDDRWGM